MHAYSITNLKYRDSTLSGLGAEKSGGRWNEAGSRAVYCSENVALALLEYYVHSDNIALLPKEVLVAIIEWPDTFNVHDLTELPEGWNQYPYVSATARVFTELAGNRDFFALRVPSTIVPLEHNIILNPLYRDFGKVEVADFLKLPLDDRLLS